MDINLVTTRRLAYLKNRILRENDLNDSKLEDGFALFACLSLHHYPVESLLAVCFWELRRYAFDGVSVRETFSSTPYHVLR
jgi:hypothetical protein